MGGLLHGFLVGRFLTAHSAQQLPRKLPLKPTDPFLRRPDFSVLEWRAPDRLVPPSNSAFGDFRHFDFLPKFPVGPLWETRRSDFLESLLRQTRDENPPMGQISRIGLGHVMGRAGPIISSNR